ncbi:uncharacterized protein LOC126579229 [Anopheles aquasalis]|uniref:uncharacterized protein LOC126579229 n=1 Tax=Anopheles aquasalis TaxID=42839 RepID=UPI00215B36F3|nr:uncharacterized protein LOC126579229 [Anopheles aquasalis]
MGPTTKLTLAKATQTEQSSTSDDSLITVCTLRTILASLSDLNKMVGSMNAAKQNSAEADPPSGNDPHLPNTILPPVTSLAELFELEENASNEDFVTSAVICFGRMFGRHNYKGRGRTVCLRLIERVFEVQFLSNCSWSESGKEGNIDLIDFENTFNMLYKTVIYTDPDFTTQQMKHFFRLAIMYAKRRANEKRQKQSTITVQHTDIDESFDETCLESVVEQDSMVEQDIVEQENMMEQATIDEEFKKQDSNLIESNHLAGHAIYETEQLTPVANISPVKKQSDVSTSSDTSLNVLNKILQPVNSLAELSLLEKKAKNDGFVLAVISRFGKMYGEGLHKGKGKIVCSRLLDQFFERDFLCNCCLTSSTKYKDKIAIERFPNTINLLFRTVINSDPEYTMLEMCTFLQNTLPISKTRSKTKQEGEGSATNSKRSKLVAVSNESNLVLATAGKEDLNSEKIEEYQEEITTIELVSSADDCTLTTTNMIPSDEDGPSKIVLEIIDSQFSKSNAPLLDVNNQIESNSPEAQHKRIAREKGLLELFPKTILSPVNNFNALHALEKKASSQSFVKALIFSSSKMFGRGQWKGKGKIVCAKLIDLFFEKEFLKRCSWTGSAKESGVVAFKDFNGIFNMFYQIVAFAAPDFTMNEIEVFFRGRLRNRR